MKSDIISIAMGELTATFDNEVMKAVRKVGVDVNKEELLKALELHRRLVRCGECKYDGTWKCPWRNTQVPRYPSANDFCSYGEPKEELNGSERLIKGSEKPNNSKVKQVEKYPYNCNWDE